MRNDKQMKQAEKAAKRKAAKFLVALTELSKEYDIIIGGCGDCESPWVIPMAKNYRGGNLVDHLYYCRTHQAYGAANDHSDC